jgi:aspartyl-tRNA(Asn)/glutamyl-tRNA(Gln) amidotransferase subunit C
MSLTPEEVRHIAQLARLKLSPQEEARFREQLSAILDHAARLSQVDTSAIPATASVLPLNAPLRADEARPAQPVSAILSNAPETQEDMFRIPPVFNP